MNAWLWRAFWIFLPFVVMAWHFKKPLKRDLNFDPLKWAVLSGVIITSMLLSVFSMAIFHEAIWNVRRIWWSCIGAMPTTTWVAIAGGFLGVLYAKMNSRSFQRLRWAAALPLAFWLCIAPPSSQLVEMNRFAPPRWKDDVCLQSTGFTCTPAAAATLLRVYGIQATESEMASLCETSRGGTHVIGLARGLAAKLPEGKFNVRACRLTPGEIQRVHLPCITFTCCHAWVIFNQLPNGDLEIGEALNGRSVVPWDWFASSFCGEAVVVTPEDGTTHTHLGQNGVDITSGNTDVSTLTLAGSFEDFIDKAGRTVVRYGSAPIDVLKAQTEAEGW